MLDNKTDYLKMPLPDPQNQLEEDCPRIVESFKKLDANAKSVDEAARALSARVDTLQQGQTNQNTTIATLATKSELEQAAQATATSMSALKKSCEDAVTSEANSRTEAVNSLSQAMSKNVTDHDADPDAHAAVVKRVVMGNISDVIGVAFVQSGYGTGIWQHVDNEGHVVSPSKRFFDFHPVFAGLNERVVCDNQIMQRHKKFYYRTFIPASGEMKGKLVRMISPGQMDGFKPYPSFMKNGQEIDEWLCGTYTAIDDGGSPKMLGSKPGRMPFVNVNFPTMQQYCANRNTGGVSGFAMWNVWQAFELRYLFVIEHANTDSQGICGRGRVDTSSAANVDAADVAQATYRGHVGLWGNVWEMVDGIDVTTAGKLRLWKNDGSKQFVDTGYTLPAYNGSAAQYFSTVKTGQGSGFDFNCLFIPETQTGTDINTGSFADYWWGRNGSAGNVCYLGGGWGDGAGAGLFCQSYSHPSSTAATWLGCRLAKS